MTLHVGVLTTHPIQYQVPWFRALGAEPGIDLEVLYCMLPDPAQQGSGFGVQFQWDIPLLDGYQYRVLRNEAANPSVTDFWGCDTPDVYGIVRQGRWDAFIVNGWVARSCLQLLAACRMTGVPCIVRGESNDLRPRAGWKSVIHRQLLRQYAAFLAIGSGNRAFYLRNGVAQERIFDAPYCIDNSRFAVARPSPRTEGSFTFLYSGKLIDKKRPLDLLNGLARVLAAGDGTEAQLLIAGDGELRQSCEAFAAEHKLPVRFLGFLNQTQIVDVYRSADCLVLPSDHGETWGLVVNEAMASGLPAIVSDQVGCHLDLVREGVTGRVFRCGDVNGLARCMQELAADRMASWRMGQSASRLVRSHYSYDQVVTGIGAALRYVEVGI